MLNSDHDLPNRNWLQALTIAVFVVAVWGSYWVLTASNDELTKGGVIATWTLFAKDAWQFWFGSSSGGKAKAKKELDDANSDTTLPR